VGSQVWLDARHIRTTRHTCKLDWTRLGPFTVVRRVSPYVYELELPTSIRIHRVPRVSLLDRVRNDSIDGQRVIPPPQVEVDGEEEYPVSSVEDCRMYRNQLQYQIQWTRYDALTWELVKFVDGLQVVGEFHQRYPLKQGPLKNVLGRPGTLGGDTVTAQSCERWTKEVLGNGSRCREEIGATEWRRRGWMRRWCGNDRRWWQYTMLR